MHEAAIAQSILNIVASRASNVSNASVSRVRVRVGSFRNVDPESLEFAFDALKKSFDVCRNAQLQIELIEARAECIQEKHTYNPVAEKAFRCHVCNSGMGRLMAGEELEISGCTLVQGAEEQREPDYARNY